MTKRRASLKGRGVDILLGGSSDDEPATESSMTPASNEPGVGPAPNPFADAASPAAAPNPFADSGAGAGAPVSFGLTAATSAAPPDSSTQVDLAASTATVVDAAAAASPASSFDAAAASPAGQEAEEEAVAGQPPAPVATSLPSEDSSWLADEGLPLPSSSASDGSSDLPTSVSLPDDQSLFPQKTFKIGGLFMSMPTVNPETFEPQTELTQTDLKVSKVSRTRATASEEEVLRRIGPERIQKLPNRIDDLYMQVTSGTIADVKQASLALDYLRQARDKELEDQRQYDEAEYLVNVAEFMVRRAGNVRQWSYTYGIVMLLYGLIWLVLFTSGLVLDELLLNWFRTFSTVPAAATSMSDIFGPYNTIMWGGIGGVLGLLYSLFKHIAVRQDFDRQFVIWYIVQPFMGMLMGAIVHLFFVSGVFTLVGATSEAFKAIGALLAIAAAFRQHYVYAWLESVLKTFEPGKQKDAKEPEGDSGLVVRSTSTPEVTPLSSAPTVAPAAPPAESAGVG